MPGESCSQTQEVPSKSGLCTAMPLQISYYYPRKRELNVPRQLTESTSSSNTQRIPRSLSTEDPPPPINHVPSAAFGSIIWRPHHINWVANCSVNPNVIETKEFRKPAPPRILSRGFKDIHYMSKNNRDIRIGGETTHQGQSYRLPPQP